MKHKIKRILILLTIIGLKVSVTQAQIYHPDDKEGLRAFLRQPSAVAGQINAQRLGLSMADTINWQIDEVWVTKVSNLIWNNETPKRLTDIGDSSNLGWFSSRLAGTLDAKKWKALTNLYCLDNQLTALDAGGCKALRFLHCSGNLLTVLDVSTNTELRELYISLNRLTNLDVSANTELIHLRCEYNYDQLTALYIGGSTTLKTLYCGINQLTTLDVSGCTALEILDCHRNQLTALNISGCMALETMNCHNNQLTSLDVSERKSLRGLWLEYNQLTALDVDGCTALETLACTRNLLTSLNVSESTALRELNCSWNQLTTLDVSRCTELTHLLCNSNHLLLSDLFVASEILKNNSGAGVLGSQTLQKQSAVIGTEVVFEPPQNIFNDIYTQFTVTKNGSAAPIGDYSVTNGKITFNAEGIYIATMTNAEIISVLYEPTCLTVEYEVKMPTSISEIPQTNTLRAWAYDGLLYITGLSEGKGLSVYNVSGALVYQTVAVSDKVEIPLNVKGGYIVISGNRSVKVVNH